MTLRIVVLDDHELILNGTVAMLLQQYPDSTIETVKTATAALQTLRKEQPSLLVTDLSVPGEMGALPETKNGILLLQEVLEDYPELNIVVQSTFVNSLVRLRLEIDNHSGGFVILDKSIPSGEALEKIDWALKGLIYTPKELRSGLEVRPEWLEVLLLAFQEGLQDKAIAETMNISLRTVRNYWSKIQDALEIYPNPNTNTRIKTEIRAREIGLID